MVDVSIITPCYNGARFLRTTLDSALAQTRRPLEIIVIDDGSTDDSAVIAESFGPPVRVLRQANQGESVARNHGIAEARGTHVLFLDADDLLAPESIERMAAAVADVPGAVGIMGCAWFEEDPRRPYATKIPTATRFYPEIIESNLMPPHCWLAPRDVVLAAGGFLATVQWFEDWDLWWRVGLLGVPLVPVPYVGAIYRRHQLSQLATTSLADQARGHASLMDRMALAFLQRPDMLAAYGEQLFWSSYTAVNRARARDVPWSELEGLVANLGRVAAAAPGGLSRSRFARAIRLLGAQMATRLWMAFGFSGWRSTSGSDRPAAAPARSQTRP